MRRVWILLVLAVCVAATASAQSVTSVLQSVANIASASNSVVDPHGNLLVFDTVYTLSTGSTGTTSGGSTVLPTGQVTTLPIRPGVTPTTRITVVPDGTGQPLVKQYSGTFLLVGAGKSAVYAVISPVQSVRKLIAIDAGAGGNLLPSDVSGFLSADLTLSGDIKLYPGTLGSTDTLTSVDPSVSSVIVTPANTTTPVSKVPRIARTITFDGIRFSSVDVVLPQ